MKKKLTKTLALLMALALLVPGLSIAEEIDATPEIVTEIEALSGAVEEAAEAAEPDEEAAEPEDAAEPVETDEEAAEPDDVAEPDDADAETEDEDILIDAVDDAVDEVGEVSLEAELELVSEPEELIETSEAYMDPQRPNLDPIPYGEPDPDRYDENGNIRFNADGSINFNNLPKPIQDYLHPYAVDYPDETMDFVDFAEDGILSKKEIGYVFGLDLKPASDGTLMTKEDLKWLEIFPKLEYLSFNSNAYDGEVLDLSGLNLPKVTNLGFFSTDNIKTVKLGNIKLTDLYVYSGACPVFEGDLSRIEEFYCEDMDFPNGLDLSQMTGLKDLSIYSGTGLEPLVMSGYTSLEHLTLTGCDTESLTLDNLPKLRSLNVSSFEDLITKVSPLDVSGCTSLQQLEYDAKGADKEELILGSQPNLTSLDVHNSGMSSLDISQCPYLIMAINDTYYEREDYETELPYIVYSVYLGITIEGRKARVYPGISVDPDLALTPAPTAKKYAPTVYVRPSATPAPTPVPAPAAPAVETPAAPAAPAAPATPTLAATKKSAKATVTAAPGTVYQLDLGGAAGKAFKSSKKKVATVDANGVVTVLKAGKTRITFKVGKKKRTVTLTVKDPTVPASIALSMAGNNPVKVGDSVTLTATLPEGTVSGIKWKSSNKKVAAVDANGVVTFKKKGKVTITATAVRGKKKAKVKFTVGK